MARPPSEVQYDRDLPRLTREEADALTLLVQNAAIPRRKPSYTENTFWSIPITMTRCRPVPIPAAAPGPWLDYLLIPAKNSYPRAIKSFVATSQNEGVVEFRWVRNGILMTPDTFDLDPTVTYNLDRQAAFPYPTVPRGTVIWARANDQLVLQVRNLTTDIQLAFAAAYGWYYPQLNDPNEIGPLEGITDVVR